MLSESQVQDLLYLHHLESARVAQLKTQREAAVDMLLGSSNSTDAILKQHPSDSIIVSNDVANQLRRIGLEQYKLRGNVYDAFFHGVGVLEVTALHSIDGQSKFCCCTLRLALHSP